METDVYAMIITMPRFRTIKKVFLIAIAIQGHSSDNFSWRCLNLVVGRFLHRLKVKTFSR